MKEMAAKKCYTRRYTHPQQQWREHLPYPCRLGYSRLVNPVASRYSGTECVIALVFLHGQSHRSSWRWRNTPRCATEAPTVGAYQRHGAILRFISPRRQYQLNEEGDGKQ